VSCKGVAFSRIRGSSKAAQILEEGGREWEFGETEREDGMGGGRESKVSAGSAS
jgi:hypothetical protein